LQDKGTRGADKRRRRFRRRRRRSRKGTLPYDASFSHERYLQQLKRIVERQKNLQTKLAMLSHKQQNILERVIGSKDMKLLSRSRRSVDQSLKTLQEVDEEDRVSAAEADQPKRRVRRAATAYKSRTWPYGVIPYVIQANFTIIGGVQIRFSSMDEMDLGCSSSRALLDVEMFRQMTAVDNLFF
uniref:Polyprotein n=1 Tax=Hydatigena taeniaeformis TaxID=6205 RepID=A0A0R3WUF4_HYDTA